MTNTRASNSRRKEYRRHSKSVLLRASQAMYNDRAGLLGAVAVERRKWKRRVAALLPMSFLAGAAATSFLRWYLQ